MIGDYHVHTKFSSDCNSEPEDLIKKAISLGMTRTALKLKSVLNSDLILPSRR